MDITYEIQESIGEQLTTELTDLIQSQLNIQYALTSNELFQTFVEEERFTPFSEESIFDTIVTVHMQGADTIQTTPEFDRMRGKYFVRCSYRYIQGDGEEGSSIAQKAIKKLASVIRYILRAKESYDEYNIEVSTMKVGGIEYASPFRADTSQNETSGQVMVEIEYKEPVENIPTVPVAGADLQTNNFKTTV